MTRRVVGHHRGFTLIELLVSVAIMAVLLAIFVPSFDRYKDRQLSLTAAQELASIINQTATGATTNSNIAGSSSAVEGANYYQLDLAFFTQDPISAWYRVTPRKGTLSIKAITNKEIVTFDHDSVEINPVGDNFDAQDWPTSTDDFNYSPLQFKKTKLLNPLISMTPAGEVRYIIDYKIGQSDPVFYSVTPLMYGPLKPSNFEYRRGIDILRFGGSRAMNGFNEEDFPLIIGPEQFSDYTKCTTSAKLCASVSINVVTGMATYSTYIYVP